MFRAGFEPGSSWVRVVSNKFKEIFPLIQYLICLETNSKPTRSVRMQWSISLMVFTTPPSGFVNVRTFSFVFRVVFDSLRLPSTNFDSLRLTQTVQRDISFDTVFDMSRNRLEASRNRLEAFECNGVYQSNGFHYAPVWIRIQISICAEYVYEVHELRSNFTEYVYEVHELCQEQFTKYIFKI